MQKPRYSPLAACAAVIGKPPCDEGCRLTARIPIKASGPRRWLIRWPTLACSGVVKRKRVALLAKLHEIYRLTPLQIAGGGGHASSSLLGSCIASLAGWQRKQANALMPHLSASIPPFLARASTCFSRQAKCPNHTPMRRSIVEACSSLLFPSEGGEGEKRINKNLAVSASAGYSKVRPRNIFFLPPSRDRWAKESRREPAGGIRRSDNQYAGTWRGESREIMHDWKLGR